MRGQTRHPAIMKSISRRLFLQRMGIGATMAASVPSLTQYQPTPAHNHTGKKLNIALCGLGTYANILSDGFAGSQYSHLAGIITGTPAKAVAWKKKFNIPDQNIYNYQDFDTIVNNKDIDLVYVVLPN